jgi:hypothetical protein
MAMLFALAVVVVFTGSAVATDMHHSGQFAGPKANTGHVVHSNKDGKSILTLSEDFVVPDTPDPHWQVVDSKGTTYRLDKLKIKALLGDKVKNEIELPAYIKDVAKVQIYCAWAETVLGEASFSSPVK